MGRVRYFENTVLVITIIIIITVFVLLIDSLSTKASASHPECEFDNGKIVVSKLTGRRGMVVTQYRLDPKETRLDPTARNCEYDVRFVTDSGWVFKVKKIRYYELEWPVNEPHIPPTADTPTGVEGLDFGN